MHVSFEGGVLEDPWAAPPADTYLLTTPLADTPDEPEEVIISFEKGIPTAVNGQAMGTAGSSAP